MTSLVAAGIDHFSAASLVCLVSACNEAQASAAGDVYATAAEPDPVREFVQATTYFPEGEEGSAHVEYDTVTGKSLSANLAHDAELEEVSYMNKIGRWERFETFDEINAFIQGWSSS
jgi:hypothetical protein